jgi:hypothetical protein
MKKETINEEYIKLSYFTSDILIYVCKNIEDINEEIIKYIEKGINNFQKPYLIIIMNKNENFKSNEISFDIKRLFDFFKDVKVIKIPLLSHEILRLNSFNKKKIKLSGIIKKKIIKLGIFKYIKKKKILKY